MNYTGKMTFDVEHSPTNGGITVEIDFDKTNDFGREAGPDTMMQCIKEMVEFWDGWELRFSSNKNDYVKTFLKSLCRLVLTIQASNNYNEYGVISQFKDLEGWLPIDGTFGIKLTAVDGIEFNEDDFEAYQLDK